MKFYSRNLMNEIKKWLDRREIIAIKGPRQSGKTILLNMIKNFLINQKKINPENIIYITFEDRDILDSFSRDPKQYIKGYMTDLDKKRYYFLMDEFQYVNDGGQKLKLLYDLFENIKFIITGSSSLELTSNTAKYLVGRMFSFYLYQFNLDEFFLTKEKNIYNIYRQNSEIFRDFIINGKDFNKKEDIFEKDFSRYFEEFILYGSYPEVLKTENIETKRIIIKSIYDTYITRDIIELLKIGDISGFRTFISLLANNIGGLINYNNLATDSQSYFQQIKHYLSILEETFVIRILRPYFSNKVTELKKNPKVYFVDSGLRNHTINNFNEINLRSDKGQLVENAILSELWQMSIKQDIKFWRTISKAEVDFILETEKGLVPIEVKYSKLKSPKISRSFRNFINEYSPSRALILTKAYWDKIRIGRTIVGFIPVWYIKS